MKRKFQEPPARSKHFDSSSHAHMYICERTRSGIRVLSHIRTAQHGDLSSISTKHQIIALCCCMFAFMSAIVYIVQSV